MSKLKLQATDGSAGTVSIKAPASTTGNAEFELTLPGNAGSNGQVLSTNGSGVLTWSNDANVGGATGVDFNDNVKARFGTGNDLEIYHTGSIGVINNGANSTAGHFVIRGDDIYLQGSNTHEELAHFVENGACELYYDNSKKFETTSDGGQVTGALKVKVAGSGYGDGLILEDNDSTNKSELTHVDGVLYISSNASTNHLTIDSSGNLNILAGNLDMVDAKAVKLGTDDDFQLHHTSGVNYIDCYADLLIRNETSETMIDCNRNGAVELFHDGSKKLETLSDGIKVNNGAGSSVYLNMSTSSGSSGYLYGGSNQIGILSEDQEWHVKCVKNSGVELLYDNTAKLETRSGDVLIKDNLRLQDGSSVLVGTGDDIQIYHSSGVNYWKNQVM